MADKQTIIRRLRLAPDNDFALVYWSDGLVTEQTGIDAVQGSRGSLISTPESRASILPNGVDA